MRAPTRRAFCRSAGLVPPAALLLLLLTLSGSAVATAGDISCIKGRVPLTTTADRAWCREGGDEDDCVLDFSFQFDSASPSGSRWPLTATVGSAQNRSSLSSLFPELIDLAFQCSTTGDVLATTRSGANGERLRFMWRYTGVSSFSCAFTFSSVDLIEDFTQFTALLAYSGRVSTFDASYTSTSDNYSIGKLASAANCPLVPVASATGGASTTSTSGSNGGASTSGSATGCTISDCRHPLSAWQSKPLRSSATWKAVQHKNLCGIGYRDLIFTQGGDVRRMGANWLAEARELVICELNAAQSACPLPTELSYVSELSAYLQNPLNCGQNTLHASWLAELRAWNDQTPVCDMLKPSGASADADGSDVHSSSHVKRRDMIIIIVVSVVAGVLCLMLLGCCCLCLCCAPLRTALYAMVPTQCCGFSCGFLLGCLGLLKAKHHPLKEDDGLRRFADPVTMDETVVRLAQGQESGPPPVFEPLLSAIQPLGVLGTQGQIVTAAHPLASYAPDAFNVQPSKYSSGSPSYYTGMGSG